MRFIMNAYQVVRDFEDAVAKFCGAPFAISVDSCTNALLLCCKYLKIHELDEITIPKRTYPSVPCSIINAGGRVSFEDISWSGVYRLKPTNIYDSAKRFHRNMYIRGSYMCLSFDRKKFLPLGKVGIILTDDIYAVPWFKAARFDGRHETNLETDNFEMIGHHCFILPEQAARGLMLLEFAGDGFPDAETEPYQDLSKYKMYTKANK